MECIWDHSMLVLTSPRGNTSSTVPGCFFTLGVTTAIPGWFCLMFVFFNWLKIGKIGKIWLIILSSFSPLDLPEIAGLTQHFPISQDVLVHIAHTDLSGETVWCLLPHDLPDKCPVVSRWEATYPPSSGPTWKGISEFYRVGPPKYLSLELKSL